MTAHVIPVTKPSGIRIQSVEDFVQGRPIRWLVKNLLPAVPGLGVIYGLPASGKTFAALDLAMSVCRGISWQDLRVKPTGVVYLAAEGQGGLVNRVRAYLQHHDVAPRDLRLEIIAQQINLLSPDEHIEDVIQAVKDADDRIGPVGLIVVDTLNRVLAGGDENSPMDMGALIYNVQRIAEATGCFCLIVHHCGKDEARGARGHSSLKGAADLEISVSNNDGARTLRVEKLKDGQDGVSYGFRLEVVDLGEDDDGDPVNSCVVVPTEGAPAKATSRRLSDSARFALDTLRQALEEHGQKLPATSTIPGGVTAVTLEQWRARFRLRYGSDGEDLKADTLKKAFKRAKADLLGRSLIGISDPYVWVALGGTP